MYYYIHFRNLKKNIPSTNVATQGATICVATFFEIIFNRILLSFWQVVVVNLLKMLKIVEKTNVEPHTLSEAVIVQQVLEHN